MFARSLSVPDFVRRFFVSCAQISEAYVDEIRVQLAENRPQRQVQERLREYIVMYMIKNPLSVLSQYAKSSPTSVFTEIRLL